jgi:hypothetical protein
MVAFAGMVVFKAPDKADQIEQDIIQAELDQIGPLDLDA